MMWAVREQFSYHERNQMVTVKNFTVDGNLVAREIVGEFVKFHYVGHVKCVIVDLGVWGQFTFQANDPNIVLS